MTNDESPFANDESPFANDYVFENGLVRGVRPGRTLVTVSSGGARGLVPVEAFPSTPVGAIALFPETTTVVVGGTITLTPTVTDSLGHRVVGRPLSWSATDDTRARVTYASPYDVAVSTFAVGTVTVIAARDGKRGTATLRVLPQPTVARLTVSPETVTVVAGRGVAIDAVTTDASGARVFVPVSWRTSDSTVATVASVVGSVTARAPGVARLTATAGGPDRDGHGDRGAVGDAPARVGRRGGRRAPRVRPRPVGRGVVPGGPVAAP